MKVEFYVGMNLVKCKQTTTLEVDDDTSDDEISEMLNDWMWNHIDIGWEKIEG